MTAAAGIPVEEALRLLDLDSARTSDLFARAGKLRQELSGSEVGLCSIINAKSGACAMDCAFCAQSSSNRTGVRIYPLVSEDAIYEAAEKAQDSGAIRFGIVTSGKSLSSDDEVATVARAVEGISSRLRILPDASLGIVGSPVLRRLKDAGLSRYHHNIETAPSFYPAICSTRTPDESFRTIERAREAGLSVCCGGIFGLGETTAQRVEFLETVRKLDPDSVPLNFYVPVAGSRIESAAGLHPMDCLKIIAVARLMMPRKEVRVCAGRERHLRSLKAMVFAAGADAMMVGDFLTTSGGALADDLGMIADCGLRPRKAEKRGQPPGRGLR